MRLTFLLGALLSGLPAFAQTITVVSGSPQSLLVNGNAQSLSVLVKDAAGNPVAGAKVDFKSPQNGPGANFLTSILCYSYTRCQSATVTAVTSGVAYGPNVQANGIAGSYNITATSLSAPGVTAVFSFINLPIPNSPQYKVGIFHTNNGPVWALDSNGNGLWEGPPADKYFSFTGQAGDIAIVGDWNGDGRSKVGVYRSGVWLLDYNGNGIWDGAAGGDKLYTFGGNDATYIPVVGDWNGDGRTKIGFYRQGFWALDLNGNGTFDSADAFYGFGGNPGETPLVGDWNGDKRTKIGYFNKGAWVLDANGDGIFNAADYYYTNFSFVPGDKPVTGDWNNDKRTKIGLYRGGFWLLDTNGDGAFDYPTDKFFAFGGNPGDLPIVADWNGDGKSKVGVYNQGFWTIDFNGNGLFDGTLVPLSGINGLNDDRIIALYGGPGTQPIIGRW